MELRPYQLEAHEKISQCLQKHQSTLLCLPTGTGKTITAASWSSKEGHKTLWLAHRIELVRQALEAFEKLGVHATEWTAGEKDPDGDVIVSTVLSTRSLHEHVPEVDIVILDESHHKPMPAYSGPNGILNRVKYKKLLGLTATPIRLDKKELGFDSIAYQKSFLDMVGDGWLAIPDYVSVKTNLKMDFKAVNGEFTQQSLAQVNNEARNRVIQELWEARREAWGKTLVFAVNVEHSNALAGLLGAQAITDETPKKVREGLIQDYRDNKFQCLVNCQVFCLDDQTEILTDRGWAGPDDMSYDHKVANWDDGLIFFKEPEKIIDRLMRPEENFYIIQSPKRDIRVTGRHRIIHRGNKSLTWLKSPVDDLVGQNYQIPICGIAAPFYPIFEQRLPQMSEREYRQHIVKNSHYLRKNKGLSKEESVQVAEQRLDAHLKLHDTHPYNLSHFECLFIGFWLGDGSKCALQSGGIEYTLIQSCSQPGVIEKVDRIIAECGFDVKRKEHTSKRLKNPVIIWHLPRGTGFGPQLRQGVYPLELYLDKDGSRLLWSLGQRQFDALLEGFWLADGDHGANGIQVRSTRTICNTNKKIMDLLQAIAVCRGWSATLRPSKKRNDRHNILWNLTLHKRAHYCVNSKAGNGFKIDPSIGGSRRAWCVSTETKNIVTRRNGFVTVMGNTEGLDVPDINTIILARPTASKGLYMQMIGRGARKLPEKDRFNIVDLADSERHYPVLARQWSKEEFGVGGNIKEMSARKKRIEEVVGARKLDLDKLCVKYSMGKLDIAGLLGYQAFDRYEEMILNLPQVEAVMMFQEEVAKVREFGKDFIYTMYSLLGAPAGFKITDWKELGYALNNMRFNPEAVNLVVFCGDRAMKMNGAEKIRLEELVRVNKIMEMPRRIFDGVLSWAKELIAPNIWSTLNKADFRYVNGVVEVRLSVKFKDLRFFLPARLVLRELLNECLETDIIEVTYALSKSN